jgi:hypothetical protein
MCMSSPHIPSTPAPQAPQPADLNQLARNKNTTASSMAGGSLLTSPSGIANSALNTGATSLLGG